MMLRVTPQEEVNVIWSCLSATPAEKTCFSTNVRNNIFIHLETIPILVGTIMFAVIVLASFKWFRPALVLHTSNSEELRSPSFEVKWSVKPFFSV